MPDEKSGFELESTLYLRIEANTGIEAYNLTLCRLTSLQLSEWAPGSIIARMNGSDSE